MYPGWECSRTERIVGAGGLAAGEFGRGDLNTRLADGVCGIIGMGETEKDRAALLQQLANLPEHPQSVPINLLVQVENTPLYGTEELDPIELAPELEGGERLPLQAQRELRGDAHQGGAATGRRRTDRRSACVRPGRRTGPGG